MKKPFLFAALLPPVFLFCQNETPIVPKTEVEASFNYRYIGNTVDIGIARNWQVLTLRAGLNARLWNGHYLNDLGGQSIQQHGVPGKFPEQFGLNLGFEAHLRHRKLESFSPYYGYDIDLSQLPLRTAYEGANGQLITNISKPALGVETAFCLGFKVRLFGKIYLNQSVGYGIGFYRHDIQHFDWLLSERNAELIGPILHLGISRAVDLRRRK